MRAVFFWLVVVAAVAAAAWWVNPRGREPDLSAFADGGRSVRGAAPAVKDLPRAVAVRYSAAVRMLPSIGGLFLVGLAAGFFARERASYSSPALAWIGKRAAIGGAALLVLFVVAPFAWPMWVPYLAGCTAAAGAATHVGNLPRRL